MYDLSTKKETRITISGKATFLGTPSNPKIYDNRVVWADLRNGNENSDIYMYDFSTKKETQITTNGSEQWHPAIYKNKIVWEDYRNGNADIYMCTLK